MKPTQRRQPISYERTLDDLATPVARLNPADRPITSAAAAELAERHEAIRSELRKLVKIWQESGPNLYKMLSANRGLAEQTRKWKTEFWPSESGGGVLYPSPDNVNFVQFNAKDHALFYFMTIVVNPHWHRLGGPCARCGNYYIKRTARQKVYCSRRCGEIKTALIAIQRKRREEYLAKVRRAQQAIDKWGTARRRTDCKAWVSQQTKLTKKWLTRAANNGDLRIDERK